MEFTNEQIARVCHAANKEYCSVIGDDSQKSWEQAEQWQRDSAVSGVAFAKSNPLAPASSQHDAWLKDKADSGWTYGSVKDASKKEHPCMVSYDKLPAEQRIKDSLFKAVVASFNQ